MTKKHLEWEGLIPTEQVNPRTSDMDRLSTQDLLFRINEEDRQVALAVERCVPSIAKVVDAVTKSFQLGGRLFYVGAGTSGRLGVLDASECPPTFGVPSDWVQAFIAGGDGALRHAVEGAEDSYEQGCLVLKEAKLSAKDVLIGRSPAGRQAY